MASTPFARAVDLGLEEALAAASPVSGVSVDFRDAVCRFEDDLFSAFPAGHARLRYPEAAAMVRTIFQTLGRRPPRLALVVGFDDPRIGGYADVRNHRIAIEAGCLHRFLVLHEAAHLIVPDDRRHGPAFTYVLQLLYRSFLDVPEAAVRSRLIRHGLPSRTAAASRVPARTRPLRRAPP